ncbi:FCS-Like Zinc finger 3 [Oryza sativa Japonica Group]|uniref:Os02g0687200 protein n=8 Tax=Oryza TaxID=4527 RepID=Q0DYJ9_ORYSJ|nr:uncharacterized protein LOC4330359 [Oryza sativa Japonica Group]XP_052142202.1 FCS-Like Zinc finger 3-like [Oryza glaberrima]EAY87114.1 hypothetical protein OsI_08516 [Oryza sativa Indica Group]EAZ24223.1 hypothetical protein OsJ_07972 [Oryza sativa Japonica Group]KAF2946407.1 hypothetical protein DAI22_02g291400 [Oryza sativa Japonica Group]BAD07584.1 unknown protein [Oryza sativa Japonica Group]BAF09689.1 Os02g0687200 [Oryza sativa Japonica Group]|eukprot:NP_001047775.1 Os02g0687200 [Oryza sativa Japonica Group]
MASASSSSSSFFDIEPLDGGEACLSGHAMDACSLCRKPLTRNCDIFMYRGNTPFCSEECRDHQMEMDEAAVRVSATNARERAARNEQRHRLDAGSVAVAANVPVLS